LYSRVRPPPADDKHTSGGSSFHLVPGFIESHLFLLFFLLTKRQKERQKQRGLDHSNFFVPPYVEPALSILYEAAAISLNRSEA